MNPVLAQLRARYGTKQFQSPLEQVRSRLLAGGPGSGRKPSGSYAWIDHPHLGALTKAYSRSAGGAHDEIARAHDFSKNDFPRGHVEIDNKKKQYHITNYNHDQRPEPGLPGRLRTALNIPRDYEVPRPKTAGPFSPGVYAEVSAAFNPDEARDPKGEWTNGPGGGYNQTNDKTSKEAVPAGKPGGARSTGLLPTASGRPTPNVEVQGIANGYNKTWGGEKIDHTQYPEVDQERARDIADAYDGLQKVNRSPEVLKAYAALSKEVQAQWDYAQSKGIKFEAWNKPGQPYRTSTEMTKDVADNKHLYFYTGGEKHPLLGDVDPKTGLTQNDKFRAVHDLFGHAAGGFGFGARGEEGAFLVHSQMFGPDARKAMTTETRGQNSWVNFGKQNYDAEGNYKNIPAEKRPFAEQKVDLLPAELQKPIAEQKPDSIFVSPNKDSLSFEEAQKNLTSPRQAEMRKMAAGIVREFTPNAKIADAIGDWHEGAENSLLIHASIKDPEALRYAAARMGLEAEQKAVIPFSVSAAGKDALWSIWVSHDDLSKIRDTLTSSGLQFRTLEPQGQETLVHVFDPGTMLKTKIQTAAKALGGRITVAKGTGEFLGSDDDREAGAKEYRKVIQDYERKKLPLAAAGRRARFGYDFYAVKVRRSGDHHPRSETSRQNKKVKAEALTGYQVDYYNRGINLCPVTNDHPPSLRNPTRVKDPQAQDGWKRGASRKARRQAMKDLVRLLQLGMNQPGIPTQGGRTASVPVFPLVDRLI